MTIHSGRPAVLYFFLFASLAAPGRFFSIFLRSFAGLGDQRIGLVLATPILLESLSKVFIGSVADASANGKEWSILVCTVAGALAFQLLLITHALPKSLQFFYVLVVVCVVRAARNPIFPCLDAYTLEYLARDASGDDAGERKARYGEERLWGAVSWGLSSLLIGIALDKFGFVSTIFPVNFFTSVCVAGLILSSLRSGPYRQGFSRLRDVEMDAETSVGTPAGERRGSDNQSGGGEQEQFHLEECSESTRDSEASKPLCGSDTSKENHGTGAFALHLVRNPRSLIFLVTVLCMSAGQTLVEGLIFLYFADLKASNSLMGLTVCVTVVFEIPLFYVSKRLSDSFSYPVLLLGGMASYVIRVMGYTLVTSSWQVLFFEPLHGVTYALVQMSSVQQISSFAPDHLQATGQSFMSIAKSVGSIVASIGGGYVFEHYGPKTAYRYSAALVSASAIFYAFSLFCSGVNAKFMPSKLAEERGRDSSVSA